MAAVFRVLLCELRLLQDAVKELNEVCVCVYECIIDITPLLLVL